MSAIIGWFALGGLAVILVGGILKDLYRREQR